MKTPRIIKIAAAGACLLIIAGLYFRCTDESGAISALEDMGFTDIQITGYRFPGCGDDRFHTGFEAKRGNRVVTGVVCSGWLKGSTVRLD